MTPPTSAPFGTWKSPITARLMTEGAVGLGGLKADGDCLYWLESRPSEAGRSVLVCRTPDGAVTDLTPAPFNVRTRAHEYGGGAFGVGDGVVVFANFADQRVYRLEAGADPRPITPEAPLRYADFDLDPTGRRAVCVCEDHRGSKEPVNALVMLDLEGNGGEGRVLVSGADFYAAPRLSPDGRQLAWLSWNHPNMPWDGTTLWLAGIAADGVLTGSRRVAGGADISAFQPEWSPDGMFHFVDDSTGWWNLYCLRNDASEALCPRQAEFGLPLWQFGMKSFGFLADGRLVCRVIEDGVGRLATITQGRLETIATPVSHAGLPQSLGGRLALIGATRSEPPRLSLWDPDTNTEEVLKRATGSAVDPGYVSQAEAITFPTADGLLAHAFYYPPHNRDHGAPAGELPPLIVRSHGGPTGATSDAFSLAIQYWTSRGFAVVDVNYGGSTGYGRAYRRRLEGRWGIVDVEDCVNAARFLAESGRADPDRLIIRGGSAGGYTTLAALAFRDTFRAGASLYGIGDLMALAQDTHKFESRYLDRLIGPLPQAESVYRERSPVYHLDEFDCPIIFFQGLDDKVVPPNQAEAMVAALDAKGLPVAYLAFDGEGHGFRKAETIVRAIEAELSFYGRVFGFTPADDIEPVPIRNI